MFRSLVLAATLAAAPLADASAASRRAASGGRLLLGRAPRRERGADPERERRPRGAKTVSEVQDDASSGADATEDVEDAVMQGEDEEIEEEEVDVAAKSAELTGEEEEMDEEEEDVKAKEQMLTSEEEELAAEEQQIADDEAALAAEQAAEQKREEDEAKRKAAAAALGPNGQQRNSVVALSVEQEDGDAQADDVTTDGVAPEPPTAAATTARTASTASGYKSALSTHFDGMGSPFGGCGTIQSLLKDANGNELPYVALNTNSEFSNGENCHRFVEIKLGKNCEGGGNDKDSVCNGGSYETDDVTGRTIYGYVADSCADDNYWCQDDTFHLDISKDYLTKEGIVGDWNGRQIEWAYLNGPPAEFPMTQGLEFLWKDGSKWVDNAKGFYAGLIVLNVPNGISAVTSNGEAAEQLNQLNSIWNLPQPADYRTAPSGDRAFEIEVFDIDGGSYGKYKVEMTCPGTGTCGGGSTGAGEEAPSSKL